PAQEVGPTDGDFTRTVVIPAPSQQVAGGAGVESEGELLQLGAHEPFLLDDPTSAWLVLEGGILIFTTAVERDQPVGARAHFLGSLPGQVCLGFDRARYGLGSGFLAVPKQSTKVRKIPRARLQELSRDHSRGATIGPLIDAWVDGLSKAVVAALTVK